eukprot:TRINITY_DN9865_c0_g1_i1.p1 TRINITY_DN9865_c0_g1~~TRINITY_DN9865_c0_g1_i1.p1  ORF type:complete len:264 (-),score=23.09 TRINITY_DN9865_c0_g1_i1:115-906(-)
MNEDTSFWTSDSMVQACQACNETFNAVVRKHHCRMCGGVYCDDCSKWTLTYEEAGLRESRSCSECYNLIKSILPMLFTEQRFTLYTADKTKEEAKIRILPTLNTLEIISPSNRSGPATASTPLLRGAPVGGRMLSLDNFQRLVEGQSSPTFSQFQKSGFLCCSFGEDISSTSHLCFSLYFAGETIDLQAPIKSQYQLWLNGFQELIRRRGTPGGKRLEFHVTNKISLNQDMEARLGREAQVQRMNRYRETSSAIAGKWTSGKT